MKIEETNEMIILIRFQQWSPLHQGSHPSGIHRWTLSTAMPETRCLPWPTLLWSDWKPTKSLLRSACHWSPPRNRSHHIRYPTDWIRCPPYLPASWTVLSAGHHIHHIRRSAKLVRPSTILYWNKLFRPTSPFRPIVYPAAAYPASITSNLRPTWNLVTRNNSYLPPKWIRSAWWSAASSTRPTSTTNTAERVSSTSWPSSSKRSFFFLFQRSLIMFYIQLDWFLDFLLSHQHFGFLRSKLYFF